MLEGGGEFGGALAAADRRAIDLAGGRDASVRIIPAAAAPDNNHTRAGRNGERWFSGLGAQNVASLPVIDRLSARSPTLSSELRAAGLIFLLGGFPGHLADTLIDSPAWQAALKAYSAGAVLAGSSAGAMVMCEKFFDPSESALRLGLGLLPRAVVLPHHDTFGRNWAPRLQALLPGFTLIGIDEGAAMINDAPNGGWQVYGRGVVTLYRNGKVDVVTSAAEFRL
jgi:cyanophycinase